MGRVKGTAALGRAARLIAMWNKALPFCPTLTTLRACLVARTDAKRSDGARRVNGILEVIVRTVRLIQSVKADDPYVIVGDPPALLTLSDAAAKFAIRQGWAEDTGQQPVYEIEPLIPQEPEQQSSEPSSQSEPDEPEEPKRPYGNAAKSVWIEYACAVDPDLTRDRADGMTKNDLMSKYGERLLCSGTSGGRSAG